MTHSFENTDLGMTYMVKNNDLSAFFMCLWLQKKYFLNLLLVHLPSFSYYKLQVKFSIFKVYDLDKGSRFLYFLIYPLKYWPNSDLIMVKKVNFCSF